MLILSRILRFCRHETLFLRVVFHNNYFWSLHRFCLTINLYRMFVYFNHLYVKIPAGLQISFLLTRKDNKQEAKDRSLQEISFHVDHVYCPALLGSFGCKRNERSCPDSLKRKHLSFTLMGALIQTCYNGFLKCFWNV